MKTISLALALGPLCFLASAEGPILRGPDATEYLKQKGAYNSLSAAVQAAMYGAQAEPLGFAAPNGRHDFVAHFSKAGLDLNGMGWRSSWQLRSVGYGKRQAGVRPPVLNADGTRIELRRGADVTEWYVNGARGLEQGFTLQRPLLDRRESDRLRLTMQVAGDLKPREAGEEIELLRADGSVAVRYNHLVVQDAKGRKLAARMGVVDDRVWIEVNDAEAAWPVTVDPTFVQQAYVKASNTQTTDAFGSSVAVSGDTVVVGAYWEDNQILGEDTVFVENSGVAFVFVRSGGAWSQQARLKASNRGAGDQFGWSVALDGNTLVVGSHQEDSSTVGVNSVANESAMNAGAAYVYVRSGSTWSQQAYLKASNTGPSDYFGQSVGVSGDTVVVGAPLEDSGSVVPVNGDQSSNTGLDYGAAYVFVRSGTTWSQQAYLKGSNSHGNFGMSVAISGNTVVAGAPLDEGGFSIGAAYVFVRNGSTWSLQSRLGSSTNLVDHFGQSVGISGETAVVGANLEDSESTGVNGNEFDTDAMDSGAAFVFVRSGSSWVRQAYLKASNTGSFDNFGHSVAISGDKVVVGAHLEDSQLGVQNPTITDSGAAYVFQRNGTTWSQQNYLKASNVEPGDFFGWSVAVSGQTVVVGAIGEDSSVTGVNGNQNNNSAADSGAAYVFFECSYVLSPASQGFGPAGGVGSFSVTAPAGCPWTALKSGKDVTIISGSPGNGNGTVNFSVSSNSSTNPLLMTITVGDQVFNIPQAGLPCTYALASASQNFAASGGLGAVNVTAAPSTCAWTAVSNNPTFLTVITGTPITGSGAITFGVVSNPGVARSGTLTVAGQTFTVNQTGPIIITDIRSITDFGDVPNFTSGSWLQIKGQNLAAATRIWLESDFNGDNSPTMLDGVSVTFNGTLGIMYFTKPDDGDGPSQINVLAPGGLANGPVQIVVTNPQGVSNTYTLQKTALAPGMLSPPKFNVGGRQYLVATYGSNYFFVGNENLLPGAPFLPCKPGDILYAYGVGFGDTTPFFAQGVVPRVLAPLNAQVKFQFGPVLVTPYYAGYYPNFIGLDLFGLVVPNVPDGDHLITVLVNGQPLAQTLYLTVKR